MNERRYVLISDGESHWYVCPADKQDAAYAYFRAAAEYWEPESDIEGDPPVEPEWLDRVGGSPSLVEFTGYVIR